MANPGLPCVSVLVCQLLSSVDACVLVSWFCSHGYPCLFYFVNKPYLCLDLCHLAFIRPNVTLTIDHDCPIVICYIKKKTFYSLKLGYLIYNQKSFKSSVDFVQYIIIYLH